MKKAMSRMACADLEPICIVCVHAVHDWMIKSDWLCREAELRRQWVRSLVRCVSFVLVSLLFKQ